MEAPQREPARAPAPFRPPPEPCRAARRASPAFPAMPHRRSTPAACRSSRALCPSRDRPSGHRLSRERIALDLLVQVRARHVERARRLRYVPIELAQLGEKKRPLGRVLEFLEGLALEKRTKAKIGR